MSNKETSLWGLHRGKMRDADSLFLKKDCIAIGWHKLGDLSKLETDREAFKVAILQGYPEEKPGAVQNNAGPLYRFVHEMAPATVEVARPSQPLSVIEGGEGR